VPLGVRHGSGCTILLASLAVVAACGGRSQSESTPPASSAPAVPATVSSLDAATSPRGVVATSSDGGLFIEWTRTGDSVVGTLSAIFQSSSDPTQAQTVTRPFTGVAGDSTLALTFDRPLGNSATWNGAFHDSGFTLDYTANDGSIRS